ncbi:nucleoside hydrolase, partial [Nocardioides sp.]
MSDRLPVILDCDTGTDDAVAVMLAALHPDLDLLGVTTVWGNHDVAHTTDNTLRVLDLLGRGAVGVHAGRNAPIRPRIEPLPSGRADLHPVLDLPEPESVASGDAVEWLVETLRAATQPVALVPTGPLTNL